MEKFNRERAVLLKKNRPAYSAVVQNNTTHMERIFKTGEIGQEAIDLFIFCVQSVDMLKLFLRFGGHTHSPGPPGDPAPCHLIHGIISAYKIDKRERMRLVQFLVIEQGVDVNSITSVGESPFMLGAKEGYLDICKYLVERGADPYLFLKDTGNALHAASQFGHMDVCRYLVEDLGSDIEANEDDQGSGLFSAAMEGNIKICHYLLERGAKVDSAGNQPLYVAAQVCFQSYHLIL